MRGITKRFPGVVANEGVDLTIERGQVHALLGENGAGKSTLMKILFGIQQPDEGTIELEGSPVVLRSPADAIERGIGMIHQHFMLVETLTVAENVTLGHHRRGVFTKRKDDEAMVGELAERYGVAVDPGAFIWQLSVGERQRVEILKALYRDARLLVLDEPTAVLTPQEVDGLFVTLRQMADDGRGLVFISHKLHEVFDLAHHVTVLRHGKVVANVDVADTDRGSLAELMVGRALQPAPERVTAPGDRVRLSIRDLTALGDRGQLALDVAALDIREGEILGLAGVSGNGQRELAEVLAGLRPAQTGWSRSTAPRSWVEDPSRSRRRDSATCLRNGCATAPSVRSRWRRTCS
ncbi:MAG: ATP-binding cassette domain-containing protein [Ilumatobacteraceae bacterium]